MERRFELRKEEVPADCQFSAAAMVGMTWRTEHALVDVRLCLPKEWAKDRKRRKGCGVPKEVRYRTETAEILSRWTRAGWRRRTARARTCRAWPG